MNPPTRLSISFVALIAAALFCLEAVPGVALGSPEGPVLTGGSAPWLSLAGTIADGNTDVVYTVPADRVFVVTAACYGNDSLSAPHNGHLSLLEGSTVRVGQGLAWGSCRFPGNNSAMPEPLAIGRGRLTFAPGSDVAVEYMSNLVGYPPTQYFVQGYLAAP